MTDRSPSTWRFNPRNIIKLALHLLYFQGASGLDRDMLNRRNIIPKAKLLNKNSKENIIEPDAPKQHPSNQEVQNAMMYTVEELDSPTTSGYEYTKTNDYINDDNINEDQEEIEKPDFPLTTRGDYIYPKTNAEIKAKIKKHMYNGPIEKQRVNKEDAELFANFVAEDLSEQGRDNLLNAIAIYELNHPDGQFFIYDNNKNTTAGMAFNHRLEVISLTTLSIAALREKNFKKLDLYFKHELFHNTMHLYANLDPENKKRVEEYLKNNEEKGIKKNSINVNFGDLDISEECVNTFDIYIQTLDNLIAQTTHYDLPNQGDIIALADLIKQDNPVLWNLDYQNSVNSVTSKLKNDPDYLKFNFIKLLARKERRRMGAYIKKFAPKNETKFDCGEGLANRGDRYTIKVLDMMHEKFGPIRAREEALLGTRTFEMIRLYEDRFYNDLVQKGILAETTLPPTTTRPYERQSFEEQIIDRLETRASKELEAKLVKDLEDMRSRESSNPTAANSVQTFNVELMAPRFKFVDFIPENIIIAHNPINRKSGLIASFDKENNVILIDKTKYLEAENSGGLELAMQQHNLNVMNNLYPPRANKYEVSARKEYVLILTRALNFLKNDKKYKQITSSLNITDYNLLDAVKAEIARVKSIPENDAVQFFGELLPYKIYLALEKATDGIISERNSPDILTQQIKTSHETNQQIQDVKAVKQRSLIMSSSKLSKEKMLNLLLKISDTDQEKLYKACEDHKLKNPHQPIFIDSENTIIPFGISGITAGQIINTNPKALKRLKAENDYLINQRYSDTIFLIPQAPLAGRRDAENEPASPTSFTNLSPEMYNLIYYSLSNEAFSPQYKIKIMETLEQNPSKAKEFIDYINEKRLLNKTEIPFKYDGDILIVNDNGVVSITNNLVENKYPSPTREFKNALQEVIESKDFKNCKEDKNCKTDVVRQGLQNRDQNPNLEINKGCVNAVSKEEANGYNPVTTLLTLWNCFTESKFPINRLKIQNPEINTMCEKKSGLSPYWNCESGAGERGRG